MELQEGHTVGIDLGTTFSCLAVLDEQGRPTPVANDDGDVETPSLVLLGDGGHVIVGPSRQRAAMEDPSNIIERIKRHMGSVEYKKTLDGHEITPEFLSALILKKLKQDAEERIGKVGNAVITVPYYFNDSRRKATQDAGKIAGLNVIDIINEPTAATLAYAWQRNELGAASKAFDRPKRALVFDLGGGTFDVTVVKYTPTHFQVLATDGDVQLGGVDWNDRLSEFVCQKYQEKYNVDPRTNPVAMQVLRNDCDAAKIQLSSDSKVTLNFRHEGKSIAVPITRDEFEELTADLLQRTVDTTELVLEQAKMKVGDLDALVMVGGSTLMPAVTRRIQQLTGVPPYKDIDCHTAVARGAAIHAAILDIRYRGKNSKVAEQVRKHLESVKQEDVNSHALGIVAKHPKTQRPVNHVMIPRNSKLPIQVTQTFWTNHDNQERVNVQVVEGDAPDPAACSMIGNCRITKLPENLPKGSPVEVTYAFDISGRVKVRAFDKTGGQEAAIEIDRRGGLTDAQVDLYTKLASEYAVE